MKFVSMFGADICGARATQNKFYFGPSSFAASVVEKFRVGSSSVLLARIVPSV